MCAAPCWTVAAHNNMGVCPFARSWPSFFAQAGATLRVFNTTQYFWSGTLYHRPDCKWDQAVVPTQDQVQCCNRGFFPCER